MTLRTLLLICCSVTALNAHAADDDWWFDVELIIFDRTVSLTELEEQFELAETLEPPSAQWDLLTELYQPDIRQVYTALPLCGAPPHELWQALPTIDVLLAEFTAWQQQQSMELPTLLPTDEGSENLESGDADAIEQLILSQDDGELTSSSSDTLEAIETNNLASATDIAAEVEQVSEPEPYAFWSAGEIAAQWVALNAPQLQPESEPAIHFAPLDCRRDVKDWVYKPQTTDLTVPPLNKTPMMPQGADWRRANGPHILTDAQYELDELSGKFRYQRGLNRLLHVRWRQPVLFGEDNAPTLRIYAGDNYASAFFPDGSARPTQNVAEEASVDGEQITATIDNAETLNNDFVSQLAAQLESPQRVSFTRMMTGRKDTPLEINNEISLLSPQHVDPIWQLDGTVQVFLRYINQVPYLHINNELYYRQPIPLEGATQENALQYQLVSVPFKQIRRVISTQLHYFDHPMFGMIIKLRRYHRPQPEVELEGESE